MMLPYGLCLCKLGRILWDLHTLFNIKNKSISVPFFYVENGKRITDFILEEIRSIDLFICIDTGSLHTLDR